MFGGQSHVTKTLAQLVAGSRWEAIPPAVRCEGVRGLLNFVGCALGGAHDEAMDIAVKVLAPFFGPPQGIVIGRGERPDALNAASDINMPGMDAVRSFGEISSTSFPSCR